MSIEHLRVRIEQALNHPFVLIPKDLLPAFDAYQLRHYRRFLLIVNLLAQSAYFSFGIADVVVLPDIGLVSALVRTVFLALTLPLVLLIFRHSQNVGLMDLLLPVLILVASILWYEMLARSSSALVPSYIYASLIFIALANLCIQVRFLPALIVSLLISSATLWNAYRFNHGDLMAFLVFTLVYLPVVFFSLFNSWSTTYDRRCSFLRALLDDLTRQELAQANQKLERIARTDSLTGLANRRDFEERGGLEVERARRNGTALSAMVLDVDHFKRINDTYGHPIGDLVLQSLSRCAGDALRKNDLLARCGGEEFHVLLPDAKLVDALDAAERLRLALSQCHVPIDQHSSVAFTVSIGVAQMDAATGDLETTIQLADKALYLAKTSGRNRVCSSLDLAPALSMDERPTNADNFEGMKRLSSAR